MMRSSATKILARCCAGRFTDAAKPKILTTTANTNFTPVAMTRRNFASFSMEQLKDLRAMSGAPIVDCKKALGETDGDVDKAMDWLREHGAAKASKKVSGRDADEGLVSCEVSEDGKSASLVKVCSETDFAGKSSAFVEFVTHVAGATLSSSSSGPLEPEAMKGLKYKSKSVQTALEDAIVAIRENLGIATAIKLTSEDGILCSYVHGKVDGKNAGSAAAIVEIVGTADTDTMKEAGRKLAMHIVAAKPSYLDPDSVPSDIVEKEKAILMSQLADSGKPPEVLDKIVNGRIRKFFEENCLTEQEHMVEEKNPKVAQALKQSGLTVKRFEYSAI